MYFEILLAIGFLAAASAAVQIAVLIHVHIVTARAARHIADIKQLATGHLAEPSLLQDSSASSSS
jgi:hypothetical protein